VVKPGILNTWPKNRASLLLLARKANLRAHSGAIRHFFAFFPPSVGINPAVGAFHLMRARIMRTRATNLPLPVLNPAKPTLRATSESRRNNKPFIHSNTLGTNHPTRGMNRA